MVQIAEVRRNEARVRYVCCPYCGKKQFPLSDNTEIYNLLWKCKDSACKDIMAINVDPVGGKNES